MSVWEWILRRLGIYRQDKTTTTTTNNITNTTTTNIGGKKMKVALVQGINDYIGTQNDLRGCCMDARDWEDYLKNVQKFDRVDILLDGNVTIRNVKDKIKELSSLNPSIFVWCNSSHGSTIPDYNGDEADSKDECLCLYDGFFSDDDIRKLLDDVESDNMDFIFFSDSCHSGTLTKEFLMAMNDFSYISIPKYMPPSTNIVASGMALLPTKNYVFMPKANKNEILFAGCFADEFSYDSEFSGRPNGTFTYYCLKVLKENTGLTYEDFYNKLRTYLPNNSFRQTPQFEPSNEEIKKKIMFG